MRNEEVLKNVNQIIEHQETNAHFIRTREILNKQKMKFVNALNAHDPKWRDKIQAFKEFEMKQLRYIEEKYQKEQADRLDRLSAQLKAEEEIKAKKTEILKKVKNDELENLIHELKTAKLQNNMIDDHIRDAQRDTFERQKENLNQSNYERDLSPPGNHLIKKISKLQQDELSEIEKVHDNYNDS